MNSFYNKMGDRRGVVLLLSVMFLTAGLSISLGIFYVVFVQLQINRAARESHKAFYIADTAKECAAYYRNWVGDYTNFGFWDIANPCNGDCTNPANIPICHDQRVYMTSQLPALVEGVDYNAPGDAPLTGPDEEGPLHEFKFTIQKDDTCANVTVTTQRRIAGGYPFTRLITDIDGFSSCNKTNAVNRSFRECISTAATDDCQ